MTGIALDLDAAFRVTLPPRPYPGLRPFEKDEWPIFFGRERIADAVVSHLMEKRVLVVHGDSGCGKSSLVRAAVLPRLEQEHARSGIRWRTCAATPGEEPLWNLAGALAAIDGDPPALDRTLEIRRVLNLGRRTPDALAGLLRAGRDDQICILLDQFEELFAHARRYGGEEAQLLADVLIALHAQPPDGLYAVLTMRSEFLGACARFRGLAEMVNETQYLLPRMEHDDLLRAIREPATLYDGEITRDLAERLIADAGGGQDQLPLIQHGLMLLHQQNAPLSPEAAGTAWRLGLEQYKPGGGLARLLSDHADAVMAAIQTDLPAASRVVEELFRALTDINAEGQAIRRPCTVADLIAVAGGDEATVRTVVNAFRREGVSFLKPYGREALGPKDPVDISHEALIRCWSKIADPQDGWLVREFKSGLIWRALLVQAESLERDPTNVLPPATTDERERWLSRRNGAWAQRYGGGWERVERLLQASVAARDQQTRQQEEDRRRQEAERLQAQRFTLLRNGFAILALLLAAAVYLAYQASTEREEALRQFAAVQAARDEAEAARARSEQVAQEARQSADALNELVDKLRAGANASTTPSPETVRVATDRLAELASDLSGAASGKAPTGTPVPVPARARIYIQIADASQRQAAREFGMRLGAVQSGGVTVPGVELVKSSPPRSILRCFRADECANEGKRLVDLVNGLLETPHVILEDLSGRYGSSANIRPRHYELWFAPGPITLNAS